MEVLALLIALLALVIAGLAYIRAGGKEEIQKQMGDLGVKTETAREKTADVLDRIEQMVRGKGRAPAQDAEAEGESGTGDAGGSAGGGSRRGGRKRKGGGP